MDIYLDANATTPVLPQAREAALAAMADDFGNPSSIHSTGLKARVLIDTARARARQLLGAPQGRLLFTSGATEGIQTAVLSVLNALRERRSAGEDVPALLLYGATEHKAVPEALKHWNTLLGLHRDVLAIPVDAHGRHDLAWLRRHAPDAALICTMAANNETGVISDLDGIEAALEGTPGLWLVDGVQGLGKLDMRLNQRRIDYAPFSGHKLYAPKGIGLLYVREGAPFTPLMAGGGQEAAQRAGTENMSGIAALGAVLTALDDGRTFRDAATLERYRAQLAEALQAAFPGVVFNAPLDLSLPTTLNFSVPEVSSRLLLDLFDAAEVRISGGSACSSSKAEPSYVLQAMGLPEWQTASAVRLSFGPATDESLIHEACARIRACGESLRRNGLSRCETPFVPAVGSVGTPRLLDPSALQALVAAHPEMLLVDVREPYEQGLGRAPELQSRVQTQAMPLSCLPDGLKDWTQLPVSTPVVFFCRSGNRSAQAAQALRQAGHEEAYTLAGGLALWPQPGAGQDAALYV